MKIIAQYRSPSLVQFLGLSAIILLLFITPALIVSAAPVNLILNPSLETASSDPSLPQDWVKGGWGTNTRVFVYPAIGYEGAKAAKVEITSYTNGDAKWYFKEVPVTSGQTYTFSNNYISSVPSFISARFKMTNGTFTYFDLPQVEASPTSWKILQGNVTVPANVTSMTVFHVIKQVGYLTTDNFSLVSASTTPPPPPPPPPPAPSGNLIQNPTFEALGANGDPAGWFRGGYGNNTRGFGRATCPYFYTESDLLLEGNEIINFYETLYRPTCPPNSKFKLSVSIDNYVDGNAKWYFADVPISVNKNFRLSYIYQDYTRTDLSQATVRYAFADGSFQYVPIGNKLRDFKPGGMGYVGWVYTEHDFTAPTGATSLTVFFSVQNNSLSGGLNITNPSLILRNGTELPPVSPDLSGPTAMITSPISGSTVSGTTTVLINANDNVSVGAVRLYIDGIPGPIDNTFPYSFDWDTTTKSDTESRTLSVRTVDKRGSNIGGYDSANTIVTVKNDNTSPTLFITSPINGATVSGTTTVSVNATDNKGVSVVSLFVDGIDIGKYDFIAPYSFLLDTSTLSNATHTLMALAWDASNNSGTSSTITVNVLNGTPPPTDTTIPSASITSPTGGATLSGNTTVSVSASDNIAVAGVTLLVDGSVLGTEDTVAPYEFSWNTASSTNASHTFTARARDTSGNIGTSSPVSVTVSNVLPPPPPPPAPTNLIPNPSFESPGVGGDPTNWSRRAWGTNVSNFIYPGIGADGNKAVKIEITSYTNGDAKWRFNDISVVGGRSYTFNNSYKSSVATELGAWYQTPAGKQYQVIAALPASLSWVPVTRQITVPTNASMLSVTQTIYRIGTLEVDDFSLTENP